MLHALIRILALFALQVSTAQETDHRYPAQCGMTGLNEVCEKSYECESGCCAAGQCSSDS